MPNFWPICACRKEELLTVHQMPHVLKEPYIHTGYRPSGQSWKYYLYSMLFLHNESVNVWTHFFGFFLILFKTIDNLSDVDILNDKTSWPVVGYAVCCLTNLIVSTGVHLLHSKSRWHHYVFFMMDYMGVTIFCFGSGIATMFACSTKMYFDAMFPWFLPLNVLLSWFAFFTLCMAKFCLTHQHRKKKTMMTAGVGLQITFIATPLLSRYYECLAADSCSVWSLNHLALVLIMAVLCAITFVSKIPETWIPGRFDFFGHGHQIFHVVAVMAMLAMLRAMDIDIHVHGTMRDLEPRLGDFLLAFVALLVLEGATLWYCIRCSVLKCEKRDDSLEMACAELAKDTPTEKKCPTETSSNLALPKNSDEETLLRGEHGNSKKND
ncbi:membrane progestin receptor alpha-B-like [Physella acuta]|uniref:membrane progestin receptor alpha-B-like n=1 Tax=Physella acuta TaxID=109671 RepID=UPI0027DDDDEC|nr:membrane progestin receptor alpha-B-like [Physella acuta]